VVALLISGLSFFKKYVMELKIKEEFKKLIPPLTPDEYKQLEKNCIEEGIRDAIITWNGYIIDGHNRYKIAQDWCLIFKLEPKEFKSEQDVKVWMILNQFGRRNIGNYTRAKLALELEDIFKEKAKENLKLAAEKTNTGCQISDKALDLFSEEKLVKKIEIQPIDTKKEVAKVANLSHDTIAKVKIIEQKAAPEIKEKLSTGELSINQAYQDIKKEENKIILEHKKEENAKILSNEVKENKPIIYISDCRDYLKTLDDNSFDLLITDPPYSTDVDNIEKFAESWVNLALSKVKKTGRAFICIGAYPKEINAYLNILLKQDKFIVDNPLIWSYKNTLGITPKMKYNLNYQIILHLYSDKSPELDISITNEMFNVMEINAPDGRLGNRYHTWQKPDELGMRLIKHSTKENDKVLDCFACTGTFLLMAAKMNRQSLGCEINIDNSKIAKERGCTIIGM
jgi:DNA modification methylase